jgi:hypothetical protein
VLVNDENVSVGYSKGMRFVFRDEDNVIEAEYSPISGKELVRCNDQIVSTSRSLKLKTSHDFKSSNSHEYRIELKSESIAKGELKCSLYKDQKLVQEYKLYRNRPNQWPVRIALIFVSIAIAIISSYFSLNVWLVGLASIPFVLFALWLKKTTWEYETAS